MFKYLWSGVGFIDWGIVNLEWAITVLSYNKNIVFLKEILISDTFRKIVRLQQLDSSMTFLEEFIIHNMEIPDELKEELMTHNDMLIYDFMGSLSNIQDIYRAKELSTLISKEDKKLIQRDS